MTKFDACIHAIDDCNRKDITVIDGKPKEFVNSIRMSEMLKTVYPNASVVLQIASRAFHIERWIIPRKSYPMTREGYLHWRTKLKEHHAAKTVEIMTGLGFEQSLIDSVEVTILRKKLKSFEDAQKLEDLASLVFLKYDLDDFIKQHSKEKCIDIIQKTWAKISKTARKHALNIPYSTKGMAVIQIALADQM